MKTLNRSGRGTINPLFSAARVSDLQARKHLLNKGIIVTGTPLTPKALPTDEEQRQQLIAQGLIKPKG